MLPLNSNAFDRFVKVMLPQGGLIAVIADAYIDDSGTHDNAPILCAGGYLFTPGNADKFNAEMQPVLDRFRVPYIRMADLNRKWTADDTGIYRHLTDAQRDKLARIFIRTVKRRTAYGFAATIDAAEYNRVVQNIPEMPSAFGFLLMQCIFLIERWVTETHYRGRIAYFIEDGTKGLGEAISFLHREPFGSPKKRERYRYGGLAHVPKEHAPAVQTGDLLAWHWFRYHARIRDGHTTPRGDLVELLRPVDKVSDWVSEHVDDLQEVLLRWQKSGGEITPAG